MQYTRDSKIENLIDVVHFFEYLLYEKKLSFHPDDDFSEYVNYEDSNPCFSSDEVEICNQLMDQCFEVCEEQDMDIYSIGLASMRRCINPNVKDPVELGLLARCEDKERIFKVVEKVDGGYMLSALDNNESIFVEDSNIVVI